MYVTLFDINKTEFICNYYNLKVRVLGKIYAT